MNQAGSFRTWLDFKVDGQLILEEMLNNSEWGNTLQALASFCVFADPMIVKAINGQPLFRTIRDSNRRGLECEIHKAICDDNTSPQIAFSLLTGFKPGKNMQCAHVYSASKDWQLYTALQNIFYVPTFIAKATDCLKKDSNKSTPVIQMLRYRVYDIYEFDPKSERPRKPSGYDQLKWANFVGSGQTKETVFSRCKQNLSKRPKSQAARSKEKYGWLCNNWQPNSPAHTPLSTPPATSC